MPVPPLSPDKLYSQCQFDEHPFNSSTELEQLTQSVGQSRAMEAIEFAVGMEHEGYNLFALGSTGLGKNQVVTREIKNHAQQGTPPSDWCYVNNFKQPDKPKVLELPAGMGHKLCYDMEQLLEDLRNLIPAAFNSDEYRTRAQEINEELKDKKEETFSQLDQQAKEQDIALLRTPAGYTLAPIKNDEILSPDEFDKLPKNEQDKIEKAVDDLREKLKELIRQVPIWQKEVRQRIKDLDRETTEVTVAQLIAALTENYQNIEAVQSYIQSVKEDIIKNADVFRAAEEELISNPALAAARHENFAAYKVNLLVDNSDTKGAPVVYEDSPGYMNLVGRVEHQAQFGTLITNFTLIKPGALHKANGGYLILDARKVLLSSFAWEALKRSLRSHEIRVEPLDKMLSLTSTISLEPEPIPLQLKLVLVGDRLLYYLLKEYDPEFARLFKVAADFSETLPRTPENTVLYARLLASLIAEENLQAFSRDALARVIEQCSRNAEDTEKLSLHMGKLIDLMREADYWSRKGDNTLVQAEHVQQAIDTQIYRMSQYQELAQESIERDIHKIDTSGRLVGQVNGLSVVQLGDHAFGRPSKISATARLGKGEVLDIEREVKLGGPIHSKAVMILSSYLSHHYARRQPLSLSASLVFEQSYGRIEGDSASVAELCALLSAICHIPLRQSLAITGSINQLGQVQAIGGVNEKIEGFFQVCKKRGLDGSHGVVIPKTNVANLMLHREVINAVTNGLFSIYAIETVDQCLELLTDMPAGVSDDTGMFTRDSFNARVQENLSEFNRLQKEFSSDNKSSKNSHDKDQN